MKNFTFAWTASIALAAALTPSASAFDATRTRTAAVIAKSPTGAPAIELNFAAELRNVVPDVSQSGIVLGWAAVGGIEPTPFRVLIPAGCFVGKRNLYVDEFRGCGVQIVFGANTRLPRFLSISDFAARLLPLTDGTYRFDVLARVTDTELVPAVLEALGGSTVVIAIGRETSISRPTRAETISGVEPEPF